MEAFDILLESGANASWANWKGFNALHIAAKQNNSVAGQKLITKCGLSTLFDNQIRRGKSLLIYMSKEKIMTSFHQTYVVLIYYLIHLANTQSLPVVINCFRTCHTVQTYVPTCQYRAKQNNFQV